VKGAGPFVFLLFLLGAAVAVVYVLLFGKKDAARLAGDAGAAAGAAVGGAAGGAVNAAAAAVAAAPSDGLISWIDFLSPTVGGSASDAANLSHRYEEWLVAVYLRYGQFPQAVWDNVYKWSEAKRLQADVGNRWLASHTPETFADWLTDRGVSAPHWVRSGGAWPRPDEGELYGQWMASRSSETFAEWLAKRGDQVRSGASRPRRDSGETYWGPGSDALFRGRPVESGEPLPAGAAFGY